jgi:hypothetical protein
LQFHGGLRSPHPRAFLPGDVQNLVDQPLAGLLVNPAEDAARDLHQVAVELSPVPRFVDVVQLVVVQAQPAFHQVVCLGDQLHETVFDTVVNHFDEVPGRTGT